MAEPRHAPRRRGWGSVRLRVTLAVTALFAVAMAVGSWALVQSVENSLVDQVRADDRPALEKFAQLITSAPGRNAARFVTGEPTPVAVIDQTGNIEVAREISPGQTTYWALGPASSTLDPQLVAGSVRTDLVVDTPAGELTLVALTPMDLIHDSTSTVTHALMLAVPSLVILIGVLAWFTTGRALRPVVSMARRVDEISASTLHERLPVPATDDEVAALADTMNAMLDRLEDSATRQMRFISDASHELRSPVAAIRTELEVGLLHPEGTEWIEAARNVLAEDERLERIVADLLTLARSDEQATSRATAARASATTVAGPIVAAEAARARRVPVDVWEGPIDTGTGPLQRADLPDAPPAGAGSLHVTVAAHDLERALRHLLDNAARHARSQVRVGVSSNAGWVLVSVDDDGPGVAPDDRARIFERFGRLDEARSRDAGGAGLGLAVVARLVGAAGGRVWVEDGPLGGARFVLALPPAP